MKREEKSTGIVHGLAEAVAVGRAAADAGFDWPGLDGVLAKVREEHGELLDAIAGGDRARMEAELGDLLFALASVARHLGIDPERALAGTIGRFGRRFEALRAAAAADGVDWDALTLEQLEARWQQAKRNTD